MFAAEKKREKKTTDKFINPFPSKPKFLLVCGKSFENAVGKGEIGRNKRFLLLPQCFLPYWRTFCHFIKFKIVICKLSRSGRV